MRDSENKGPLDGTRNTRILIPKPLNAEIQARIIVIIIIITVTLQGITREMGISEHFIGVAWEPSPILFAGRCFGVWGLLLSVVRFRVYGLNIAFRALGFEV